MRATDLPFWNPPTLRIDTVRRDGRVVATLRGVQVRAASVRWEAEGAAEPAGASAVLWEPSSPADQLRVAVRTAVGVAVVAVRASQA